MNYMPIDSQFDFKISLCNVSNSNCIDLRDKANMDAYSTKYGGYC